MTVKEKRILRKLRKWLGPNHKPYMFWFICDSWHGGYNLSLDQQFRNQYTIPAPYKHVVKNW